MRAQEPDNLTIFNARPEYYPFSISYSLCRGPGGSASTNRLAQTSADPRDRHPRARSRSVVRRLSPWHRPYGLPYRWLLTDQFDSEALIGGIGVPIMILHGIAD